MPDDQKPTPEECEALLNPVLVYADIGLVRRVTQAYLYEIAAHAETREQLAQARELLNTPEILDFMKAVPLEAAHQRERWGSDYDAGKTAADWFWLVGYLAGKALHAATQGSEEKALHHTISTAAALANWHSAILGKTNMRPGIMPPEEVGALRAKQEGGQK